MYLEASLSRKVTGPIRSSGVPILPVGMREIHLSRNSGFSSKILRVLQRNTVSHGSNSLKIEFHIQSSKHVSRADAVHTDVMAGPFDGEGCGKLTHSGLGGVVRSLRLGHVDDSTRHATNHDNAARNLALHEVFGNPSREKVCSINVNAPKLL